MQSAKKKNQFYPEEYLLWEESADVKHEYIAGEVLVQAGAMDSHVTVSGNFLALFINIIAASLLASIWPR